ncbi:MAG: hypothetical protein E6G59_00465, partial [Actinobacteria bacterium]
MFDRNVRRFQEAADEVRFVFESGLQPRAGAVVELDADRDPVAGAAKGPRPVNLAFDQDERQRIPDAVVRDG